MLLAALSLIGNAFFSPYAINGDVASYFDLADQIQSHNWGWVVNGYWNPLYPALLAAARTVTHADVWREMLVARLLNVPFAYLVLLASLFLADSAYWLSLERSSGSSRLSRPELLIGVFTITYWLIVRTMDMNAVRPDLLLAFFLFIAFGAFLQILRTAGRLHFGVLGAALAMAFLTKSVAFSVLVLTVFVLLLLGFGDRRYFAGAGLAALVFTILAGPLIYALSKKAGHFSAGESGADNYAWFTDGAERFEQQRGEPNTKGAAVDHLMHVSRKLLANPPVYDFGNWMPGTETQWFDPAYWNAGLTPKFAPALQVKALVANAVLLARIAVMNFQVFLPVILVALVGGSWARADWGPRSFGAVAFVALALIGMYLVVLLEGRYIAAFLVVLLTGTLAFAYVPNGAETRAAIWYPMLMLLAVLVVVDVQDWSRAIRNQMAEQGTTIGSYNREVWTAAQSLVSSYGIQPGDRVACYGEGACRDDDYWARLARANIRTEVYLPQNEVLANWAKAGHNPQFIPALQATGAKVLVGKFPAGFSTPPEWHRLGQGTLYAIDLRR